MAKSTTDKRVERLHAQGLRKRVAKNMADAVGGRGKRGKPSGQVSKVVSELRGLAAEIEDRASNGPDKRKASAKKAAATRKRNAAKRSAAARKGARTRAKSGR